MPWLELVLLGLLLLEQMSYHHRQPHSCLPSTPELAAHSLLTPPPPCQSQL